MAPSLLLQISRPGLWFPTLWLYFAPLPRPLPSDEPRFWLGLLFVTFPLNFVVYGWNDLRDAATDAINPRKGSYLFGAQPTETERALLPRYLLGVGALSWGALLLAAALGSTQTMLALGSVLALVVFVNWLYNDAWGGLKQRPPFELCAQVGYLLVVPLSCLLNAAPLPAWPVWLYLSMFAVQSHLIGEVMDREPDASAGRETTATRLGMRKTKLLILCLAALECAVVSVWFDALPLSLMLLAACVWLLLDVSWLYADRRTYTLREMRLAGWGSNALALASASYVWYSGCLLGP